MHEMMAKMNAHDAKREATHEEMMAKLDAHHERMEASMNAWRKETKANR
jgi:hypothetical protein